MKLNIDKLEEVSKKIFFYLKEKGVSGIDIEEDYYWDIPFEKRYNPYEEPENLSLNIGQLEEDWNELEKILDGHRDPVAYAFVWLASLYRIIGEKLVV